MSGFNTTKQIIRTRGKDKAPRIHYTIKQYQYASQHSAKEIALQLNITYSQARNLQQRGRKQYGEQKNIIHNDRVVSGRQGKLISDIQDMQSITSWKNLKREDPEKYKELRRKMQNRINGSIRKLEEEGLTDNPAYAKYSDPDNYALLKSRASGLSEMDEARQMLLMQDLLTSYKTLGLKSARRYESDKEARRQFYEGAGPQMFTESDFWHTYDQIKARLGMSSEELMARLGYGYGIILQQFVIEVMKDYSKKGNRLFNEVTDGKGGVRKIATDRFLDSITQSIDEMMYNVQQRDTRSQDALRKYVSQYRPSGRILSDETELPFD